MLTILRRSGIACLPPLARREIKGLMLSMLHALNMPSELSLTIVITEDRESAALNSIHLGCTGPTNILSFPDDNECDLGTLVLNAAGLRRECLLYGQKEDEHLVRLLAHGLVHLSGYDHGPEMDALTSRAFQAGLAFLQNMNADACPPPEKICKTWNGARSEQ